MLKRLVPLLILAALYPALRSDGATMLKPMSFRQITTDGRSSHPAWSPKGNRIAFFQKSKQGDGTEVLLRSAKTDGTDFVTLAREEKEQDGRLLHLSLDFGAKWSPTGSSVLYLLSEEAEDLRSGFGFNPGFCCTVSSAGGGQRRISEGPAFAAEWSPSGKQIAYGTVDDSGLGASVWVTSTASWQAKKVLPRAVLSLAWSPDETRLAFASPAEAEGSGILDIASGKVTSLPQAKESLMAGLSWVQTSLVADLIQAKEASLDEASKAPIAGCDLILVDPKGQTRALTRNGASLYPAVSPDGRYVAYVRNHPLKADDGDVRGKVSSLWVQEIATGRQELVSAYVDGDGPPSWSPDGTKLAFAWMANIWIVEFSQHKVSSLPKLSPQQEARMTQMASSLKQVGMALIMYAADHGEQLPLDTGTLVDTLQPYLKTKAVFYDPEDQSRMMVTFLTPGVSMNEIRDPAGTVVAQITYDSYRTINLYADGHVQIKEQE